VPVGPFELSLMFVGKPCVNDLKVASLGYTPALLVNIIVGGKCFQRQTL
jgi:hypothetical protein